MIKPSIDTLRTLLVCDAATGRLVWRARSVEMFDAPRAQWRCSKWNGRYAGREAGYLNEKGYSTIRILDRAYLVHHVIWAIVHGEWPVQLDHKNGIENGDGITNLREATQSQNMANTRKRSDNHSGFKGVSWDSTNKKWVARIREPEGKYENLGRFTEPSEAHQAYCRRAKELYGEFARFA